MKRFVRSLMAVTGAAVVLASSISAGPSLELGLRGGLNSSSLSSEETGLVVSMRETIGSFIEYRDDIKVKRKAGSSIGGFVVVHFNDRFSIQPELNFVNRRAKVEGTANIVVTTTEGNMYLDYELTEEIELSYLEIPLLIKYRLPIQGRLAPSVFAGPVFSTVRSGTNDIELDMTISAPFGMDTTIVVKGETDISNLKDSNFGWVFGGGIGIDIGFGTLTADLRYYLGTGDLFEDVNPDDIPYLNDDTVPEEFPMAAYETGKAADLKPRTFSVLVGISIPIGR